MFTTIRSAALAAGMFALVATGASVSEGAVAVFNGTGNAYELVFSPSSNKADAEAAAASVGGTLVAITSPAEQAFIEALLVSSNAPTGSYWMGLERTTPGSNSFSWSSGEAFAYNNFKPGEPNNYLNKEDDVQIYWTQNIVDDIKARRGSWNDAQSTGYPNPEVPLPELDLINAGYVIERAPTFGDPAPVGIPLPPALLAAPIGMLVAGIAARRQRRIDNAR